MRAADCHIVVVRTIPGSRFTGYMSPDDAWERLQLRNEAGAVVGLTKLPPELRYLLAAQCIPVNISRERVKLPASFSKAHYLVGGANLFDGENVLAWFDPESPETLCVTDHRKENAVCLSREISAPAYGATPEEFEQASAAMRAQNRHESARYSQLAAKYFPPARANIADRATLEIGRQMEATREAAKKQSAIALDLDRDHRRGITESELAERDKRARELESALDFL